MLTSQYNSLVEVKSSSTIKSKYPWGIALGSTILEVYLPLDCFIEMEMEHTFNTGSLQNLEQILVDTENKVSWQLQILNGKLVEPIPNEFWTPDIKYQDKTLYLRNLPQGNFKIKIISNFVLQYSAYFSKKGQTIGSGEYGTLEENISALSNFISQEESIPASIALIAGLLEIYERNPRSLIPNRFHRWQNIPLDSDNEEDLLLNAQLALFLLSALYTWKLELPAQQIEILKLEERLLNLVTFISKKASYALDPKTGLVFAKLKGRLYGNPSYLTTACSLILWAELLNNYPSEYLHLQSLYYCYKLWPTIVYNPVLESEVNYEIATSLSQAYIQDAFEEIKILQVEKDAAILLNFNIKIQNYNDLTNSVNQQPKLALPKASSLSSIEKNVYRVEASKEVIRSSLLQSMPEGYLWPQKSQLLSPHSVFGSIYDAISTTLALNQTYYQYNTGRTSSPGTLASESNIWFEIFFPKGKYVPSSFWQVFIATYAARPQLGISRVQWAAYYAGLLSFNSTLYDYQPLKLPPSKLESNSPEISSIDLENPINLNLQNIDPSINELLPLENIDNLKTMERVETFSHLGYASEFQTGGQELRELRVDLQTNQAIALGKGKPKLVRQALDESVLAGVIIQVIHYTTVVAGKQKINAKPKLASISFNF